METNGNGKINSEGIRAAHPEIRGAPPQFFPTSWVLAWQPSFSWRLLLFSLPSFWGLVSSVPLLWAWFLLLLFSWVAVWLLAWPAVWVRRKRVWVQFQPATRSAARRYLPARCPRYPAIRHNRQRNRLLYSCSSPCAGGRTFLRPLLARHNTPSLKKRNERTRISFSLGNTPQ